VSALPRTCQCVGDICACGLPTTVGSTMPRLYVGEPWTWTAPPPARLHPADVEAIAQRVAALLRGEVVK
jgi:hypothetical protein